MLDPIVISRIRGIFLSARPHVRLARAADLLGWTADQLAAAIAAGELSLRTAPPGKWLPREELMAKALELWPRDVIEDALGPDAPRILPAPPRTAELRVRLPRYQIAMLEYRAGQHQTTVSGILARHLDDIASAHAEELSAAIPGFREALTWPGIGSCARDCYVLYGCISASPSRRLIRAPRIPRATRATRAGVGVMVWLSSCTDVSALKSRAR